MSAAPRVSVGPFRELLEHIQLFGTGGCKFRRSAPTRQPLNSTLTFSVNTDVDIGGRSSILNLAVTKTDSPSVQEIVVVVVVAVVAFEIQLESRGFMRVSYHSSTFYCYQKCYAQTVSSNPLSSFVWSMSANWCVL